VTATERKRLWRERNPERSRESERLRAQARRNGYWGQLVLGEVPKSCASSASYWKHEHSFTRIWQRLWYPTLGAGAHRLTKEQRHERIQEVFARKRAEIEAQCERQIAALVARHSAV
jgi:hypothetical protein